METANIYIFGRVATSGLSVCDLICPTQNSARSTRSHSNFRGVLLLVPLVFRVPVSLAWASTDFVITFILSQCRVRAGAEISKDIAWGRRAERPSVYRNMRAHAQTGGGLLFVDDVYLCNRGHNPKKLRTILPY